ncbi:YlxR family protein [Vulgatibacter sp.]|uniref:YlxR family protein n=1 Tax=Vulgatibacter sp. TaxID=1971226 RepID=UPI0035626FBC
MAAVRHEPTRTCLGCMGKEPKERLLRLVRGPTGEVTVDSTGTAPGRGAWVHPRTTCLTKAETPRALGRAFRGKAKAPRPGELLAEFAAAGLRLDEEQTRDRGAG